MPILHHVDGQLGVATPEVVATGHLEGWPYLVMTRLGGVILADVWPSLAKPHCLFLGRQLGEILARLHAVPTSPLLRHPVLTEGWLRLVGRRIKTFEARFRGSRSPRRIETAADARPHPACT
jgi:hygromycin-B 7''-O-kinase